MALTVKRPERTVVVCLDGSLTAQWEGIRRQVEEKLEQGKLLAQRIKRQQDDSGPNRKSPDQKKLEALDKEVAELSRDAERISVAAADANVTFTLRALPRHAWDALVAEHPARPEADDGTSPDRGFPFHIHDAVAAALRQDGCISSVTHADGTEEPFAAADWPAFEEQLTAAQFTDFQEAVISLNVGANDVPFFRASAPTRSSGKS